MATSIIHNSFASGELSPGLYGRTDITKYASGWTLERIASVDRNLLRLALCEMLFRSDIPYSVSINEAVELAKIYSTAESGKFVNGILGNFARASGFVRDTRPGAEAVED